jgi:hypothetical protein
MVENEHEASTVSTQVGASLLMLPDASDLARLQREGWIASAGRDRWRVVEIVQGHIRFLKSTIATATTQELSAVFGISGMRIRQLAAEGWFKPAGKNRWNRDEATTGYIKFLRAEDRRSTKSAAENRVRDAKAREIEMRLAERARELIAVEEAETALDTIVGMVRTEMGAVPARCTRDLALRHVIEKAINDGLSRIVARLANEIATLQKGSPGTDAVEHLDA